MNYTKLDVNNRYSYPDTTCWVWVIIDNKTDSPELAYFHFIPSRFKSKTQYARFEVAETVGDYEGLNTEYYNNVTHWIYAIPPKFTD